MSVARENYMEPNEIRNEILEEESASRKYRRWAEEAEGKGYYAESSLLKDIAADEARHASILKSILETVESKEPEMHGGYYWEVANMTNGEIMQYNIRYPTTDQAVGAAKVYLNAEFPQFKGHHLVIKIFNKSPEEREEFTYTPTYTESYWITEGPMGIAFAGDKGDFVEEMRGKQARERAEEVLERISEPLGIEQIRLFPKTYGDWVNLAEDIKGKYPDDPIMKATVNFSLQQVALEDEEPTEAREERLKEAQEGKRWLMQKAGELDIK